MQRDTSHGLLIKQIHNKLEKSANNSLREKGLTMMQVEVLVTLHETPEKQLSMKEMERYFQVAQSTVAGIISRLEQKGLVEAVGDKDDKRVKLAHITAAGEACCEEAACAMDETDAVLLRGFTEEEKELFNRLLMKAAENLG